jgi:hypothetical protein
MGRCTFRNNTCTGLAFSTTGGGGALSIGPTVASSITNCTFSANSQNGATAGQPGGGAIYNYGSGHADPPAFAGCRRSTPRRWLAQHRHDAVRHTGFEHTHDHQHADQCLHPRTAGPCSPLLPSDISIAGFPVAGLANGESAEFTLTLESSIPGLFNSPMTFSGNDAFNPDLATAALGSPNSHAIQLAGLVTDIMIHWREQKFGVNAADHERFQKPGGNRCPVAVEVTGNLSSWDAEGATVDVNTPTMLKAHDNTPRSTATSRFIRLKATRP